MIPAHLIGIAGAAISFLLFVPQARLVWANRARPDRLAGISILGQILIIANAGLWGLYAAPQERSGQERQASSTRLSRSSSSCWWSDPADPPQRTPGEGPVRTLGAA
nr:hypothetical protein GCM10025699_05090 [Microbacterium flavescens]